MAKARNNTGTEEPIEKQLWKSADNLRKNIDAAEYKCASRNIDKRNLERAANRWITRSSIHEVGLRVRISSEFNNFWLSLTAMG